MHMCTETMDISEIILLDIWISLTSLKKDTGSGSTIFGSDFFASSGIGIGSTILRNICHGN